MTRDEAIAFYGGNKSALASALGIHQTTLYSWINDEVPLGRQYQLQELSGGVLKVDPPEVLAERRRKRKEAA